MRYIVYLEAFWLVFLGPSAQGAEESDAALLAQTMRGVQARVNFLSNYYYALNEYVKWPACLSGQEAPPFPSDDFYAKEMEDPERAALLVDCIASAWKQKTYYWTFVKVDQVEGYEEVGHYAYDNSDFTWLNSAINSVNYSTILKAISQDLKKLNTREEYPEFVETGFKAANGSEWLNTPNCWNIAESKCTSNWNNASWGPTSGRIGAYSGSSSSVNSVGVSASNYKGKLSYDLSPYNKIKGKTAKIYLRVDLTTNGTTLSYNQSPATTVPNHLPVDSKFHFWKDLGNLPSWTSDILAEAREPYPAHESDASWYLHASRSPALITCEFETTPDDGVACCGGGVAGCSSGFCAPGSLETALNSVHVRIAVGSGGKDKGSAYLLLNSGTMSPNLSTPSALTLVKPSTVSVVSTSDGIRQIVATNSFVDIVSLSTAKYEIRFYPLSAKSLGMTNGVYTVTSPGSLLKTIAIENPLANHNDLKITETENGVSKVTEYTFAKPMGIDTWSLTTGNGAKTESFAQAWNADCSVRTDTRTVSGPPLLDKTVRTYSACPWGKELTKEVNDPDGIPLTSTWDYYTNPTDNGYGRVKQWVDGKGYWERYEYDADGLIAKTIRQYLAATSGATENQSDVETIVRSGTTTTTVQTIQGNEVARSITSFPDAISRKDEVCIAMGAASGASTNLVTLTKYTDSSRSKVASVCRPDGTMTFYQYSASSITVLEGKPNAASTAIEDGTSTTTAFNSAGYETTKTVVGIGSSTATIGSEIGGNFDPVGRAQTWTYLDGTTKIIQYGCCGIGSETDRDGITTTYSYDALGNPDLEVRAGITMDYDYDALGRLTKTTRIGNASVGPNPASIVTQAAAYDVGGRQTSSTDVLGASTVSETYVGGGQTRVETLPGGATRVQVTTTDGKLLSVGGTAEHGLSYQYGSTADGRQFTREIQAFGPSTTRYVDMAGRDIRTEYPGGAAEQLHYNTIGQMDQRTDPDGIVTSFTYNPKGELDTQTVGTQATTTTRDVATHGADTVLRTTVKEAGNVTVSVDEQSVTSRRQWRTDYGLITSTETTGTGAAQIKTITAPDASTTVETYANGRLTGRTATNAVTSFTYDGNGRPSTETDARTGRVTTTTYYNTDRVQQVSQNGGAAGTLATSHVYTYESSGLVDTATLPGTGRTSIRKYDPDGDLKSVGGTAEYPVSYAYDAQGRMRTMTTAAGVTTWTYSRTRGWLNAKNDGVNRAVTYGYYPSGRLKTRTWSRGVVTGYKYDSAGNLANVDYSDGTAAVAILSDNRGRQQTVQDAAGLHTFAYWNGTTRLMASDTITGAGILAGVTLSNAYDGMLRRTTYTAARSGTKASYTDGYDAKSRLATVTDNLGLGLTATYAYLASSSLVDNVVLKQGGTTRVTLDRDFDNLDRQSLGSAIPAAGPAVSYAYHYDPAGQRDTATLADGSYWGYGYDALGQVTVGSKKWNATTDVFGQQYGYTYDGIGNRLTTTVNARSATYAPNALNQYTSRTVPGYADVLGEILPASTLTVNSLTPTRQNANAYFRQELAVSNASAPVWLATTVSATNAGQTATTAGKIFVPKTPEAYTYDPDGNLLSDGRWTYRWDGENRLKSMETQPAAVAAGAPRARLTFAYDGQSRRISKKVETWNGSAYVEHHTFLFLYDGWNLAAEIYKQTGQALRSYVWGSDVSGGQGAGGIGGLLFIRQSPENKSFSVGYDGNGNVTALHDMADSSLAARYEYGPFGEPIRASGYYAPINPIRWSTKYQDPESDLIYYGYRYYTPSLDRWLNNDPLNELSFLLRHPEFANTNNDFYSQKKSTLSEYQFLQNSPIQSIDTLGLTQISFSALTEITEVALPLVPSVALGIKTDHSFKVDDKTGKVSNEQKYTGKTFGWVPASSTLTQSVKKEGCLLTVNLKGTAHNWANPFLGSIDYNLTFTINPVTHETTLRGTHDGYPSYSIMGNGHSYRFRETSVFSLYGSGDITVNKTWR